MRRHRLDGIVVAAAVAALSLLVAACSGDDTSSTTTTTAPTGPPATGPACQWPMFGHDEARSFAYPCDTAISPDTVGDLREAWFFNTEDVVTAAPAVMDGVLYAADWAGNVYAVDSTSGTELWRSETVFHPVVYSGQVVASPAVADVDDQRLLFVGGGKTMHAFDTVDGDLVWSHELGEVGNTTETTEIQSSPVVADGKVIFGFDAHDFPGLRAGVMALDAGTGDVIWDFDPDLGAEPTGCAGVWSSPTVDTALGSVFFGTANCTSSPDGWTAYSEALVAISLDTGEPLWTFQPHEPNRDDFDFAGSPNLFDVDGTPAVGLGNKDGVYYAVDRETGDELWNVRAATPDFVPGSNFSFGGFIGATAYADGVVAGGTAGQGANVCPCLHGIDVDTGDLLWQARGPLPIYGPSAIANGVVFAGGIDFTLRGVDLHTGEILWAHEMSGVVAGGPVIVGNDVFAVAGLREPGVDSVIENAGITRFTLDEVVGGPETTTSSSVPANTDPVTLESPDQACVGEACEFAFNFPPAPEGLSPTGTLLITTDPFSIRIESEGLGDPIDWVSPDAPDYADGARFFVAALVVSEDNPVGTFVCTFDEAGVCEGDTIPALAASYNRLAILALPAADEFPSIAEGVARLVYTRSFAPLVVIDPPPPEAMPATSVP